MWAVTKSNRPFYVRRASCTTPPNYCIITHNESSLTLPLSFDSQGRLILSPSLITLPQPACTHYIIEKHLFEREKYNHPRRGGCGGQVAAPAGNAVLHPQLSGLMCCRKLEGLRVCFPRRRHPHYTPVFYCVPVINLLKYVTGT